MGDNGSKSKYDIYGRDKENIGLELKDYKTHDEYPAVKKILLGLMNKISEMNFFPILNQIVNSSLCHSMLNIA